MNCINGDNKHKAMTMTAVVIGAMNKLLTSLLFNALVMLIGFCLGYSYISCRIHYYATSCDNVEYVNKIQEKVNELAEIDKVYTEKEKEMEDILQRFWMKLSHDANPVCKSFPGNLLVK